MNEQIKIQKQNDPEGGAYSITLDGQRAEMTYQHLEPGLILIDHTFVPDALRGRGIAQCLAAYAVEDARKSNWMIRASCSFMQSQFEHHPEWADVAKRN